MLKNKNILLAVTGGIAVYKVCDLASKLSQQGANVKVMMTKHATEFVAPLTFQALTRNEVYIDTFDEKDPEVISHIDVADWAEIAIIAPATANILGKLANGIADDMVSTTLLATRAKIFIAPAMNVHMYENPIVQKNIEKLLEMGCQFIEPGEGFLACGYVGKGRLEEPVNMIQKIEQFLKRNLTLRGKKVLISAGPTREQIDPVRFFTNRSSGKMGFALAEVAAELGAHVILVSGPVQLTISNPSIERIDVVTAEEMYEKMVEHFPAQDIVIMAAAVADYRPKRTYDQKLKKQSGILTIEMERTKDILATLGEQKTTQYLVGFAAETENMIDNAVDKLKRKNLDVIVANNISEEGAGFEGDTNIVTLINRSLEKTEFPLAQKSKIAESIFQYIVDAVEDEHA